MRLFLLLSATYFLSSCGTTSYSRIKQNPADVLAVQSDLRTNMPSAGTDFSQVKMDATEPAGISMNDDLAVKPAVSSISPDKLFQEKPSRKSVKAEMQQFTREQKKEIRKAVLYAYLGKEIPVSKGSQKDGAPFVDQTAAAIIAFFIPPLGAGLYFGKDKRTWIALGLTLLFWLPGAIYAIIMILKD